VKKLIRIATRESLLALWQANYVADQLKQSFPECRIELVGLTTQGDKVLTESLSKVGGKGLFVKELEVAMLEGQADIAVHSMKDVPMELLPGLSIAAICERADARDAFVTLRAESISDFPAGSIIGTSSIRRERQLRARFPHFEFKLLRGNVNTRLAKLDAGEYDAIILAAAGLQRLGLAHRIKDYFSLEDAIPAPGQGAVGVECRSEDAEVMAMLRAIHHEPTYQCVTAERVLSRRLGGNCSVPIGAHAVLEGEQLRLNAMVGGKDGSLLYAKAQGLATAPHAVGEDVASQLIAAGALTLLAE
jgi:hydroxymethylbilane synthase